MRRNIAVILAAGSGNRSGLDFPKQLAKLAGKPVVEHTIKAFQSDSSIDEIAIVTNESCKAEIENIVFKSNFHKVKKILNGGKERWESSWSAISAYKDEKDVENINLIFHDSVRPLVDSFIIKNVVDALNTYQAVDVVIPATDTIVQSDSSKTFISNIPARDVLHYGQTPQAFHFLVIQKAYELYLKRDDLKPTDDCGIVLKTLPDVKIYLAKGSQYNQKLTYNEDLVILNKLFQFKSSIAAHNEPNWNEYNKHLDKVFVIFGHTSGIGKEIFETLQKRNFKVYGFSKSTGVDISNPEHIINALELVQTKEHKINYIINTSGILIKESLHLMQYQDILNVINTNYLGAVNLAFHAFPYLKESKGSLLFFTSSSYTYGRAFYSTYSSSKAAIVNLTQALAEEWSESDVRVNCLNPERTLTPMRTKAFGNEPCESLLKVETVAYAAINTIFAGYTGQIIDVKR